MRELNVHTRRTPIVTVRRLVGVGALSGVALLSGAVIASATTTPTTAHSRGALGLGAGRHGNRPVVDGKVTATGTNSFTVLDRSSTSYTVTVTGSTIYREQNVANVGIADVTVGTYVDVVGTLSGTDVIATAVRIEATESSTPLHALGVMPAAAGKVTAIGTDSFTVTDHAGTSLTVDVNTSTTYKEPGTTTAGFSDLKVGDFVVVKGTLSGTTVAATDVHFGSLKPLNGARGHHEFGGVHRPGAGLGAGLGDGFGSGPEA